MLKKGSFFVVGLVVLVVSVNSYAATMVDDFSYSNGAYLSGQGSAGDGWAGPWGGLGKGEVNLYVYSGAAGYNHTGADVNAMKARSFAEPIYVKAGAPTIWVSYDVKSDFGGSQSGSYFGVQLGGVYGSTVSTQNLFGRVDYHKFGAYVRQTAPYYDQSSLEITDAAWYRIWIEIVPTGDGTADYRMWVNPDYNLAPDDPNQVVPILDSTLQMTYDHYTYVALASDVGAGGTNTDRFDNLYVSTDSAPKVPEPGTLGLLCVGGVVSMICKRK